MSGSIALSLTQRYDKGSHQPLDGGLLYFYAAGTTTPQSAYQDVSLTIPWPNPITLDSGGNVPQLFFADGYVKFRLVNAAGVTQIEADFVLVLGPTSGGGAAPSVDATTVLATGDLKARYGTGVLTGFVRANGRTIGSSSSSATERANADAQSLFEFLWATDVNLSVSGGRGGTANADWVSNKTIDLPDWRGRVLAGLDDMGNSAAGRLTSTHYGTSPIVLGAASTFQQSRTLITDYLPPYTPSGTVGGTAALGEGSYNVIAGGTFVYSRAGAGTTLPLTATFTGNAQGGISLPFSIIQPSMLATIYMKL